MHATFVTLALAKGHSSIGLLNIKVKVAWRGTYLFKFTSVCVLPVPPPSTHSPVKLRRMYWNCCIHESRFCLDDVFWNDQSFKTIPCIVVHHQELECFAKRLISCLQGKRDSEGLFMTFSSILSELQMFLQPVLVKWLLIISQSDLWLVTCEKIDCCVQGQGHSIGSKFQWMPSEYLWNNWTFCIRLGVIWWHSTGLLCKKSGLLSSRSR